MLHRELYSPARDSTADLYHSKCLERKAGNTTFAKHCAMHERDGRITQFSAEVTNLYSQEAQRAPVHAPLSGLPRAADAPGRLHREHHHMQLHSVATQCAEQPSASAGRHRNG